MDIVSVQFKNGKLKIGHDGRAAGNLSIGPITIGNQNDTFEYFDETPHDEPENKLFDISHSRGQSNVFFLGGHYNESVSFLGIFSDVVNYVKERW